MGTGKGYIPVGGTVPATSSTDLMGALENQIMPQINNILPKLDSLMCNLNAIVSNPAIGKSIDRFDDITGNVTLASRSLNGTMTNLNSRLPYILNNVGRASVSIDSITSDLALLSAQLRSLPLSPTMENVENISRNLSAFSNQLNDKNSTLGLLSSDPELYNRLNRVSADIDSLILDIKKNPKRYINIKLL